MKTAYIGFSKSNDISHSGATNAGIAQSDYTIRLLNIAYNADYFICQSNAKAFSSRSNRFVFLLRKNKFLAIYDTLIFFFSKIYKSKYSNVVIYHSLLFLPLVLLLKAFGIKFIVQVNEVFSNSGTHSNKLYSFLECLILKCASDFIISTEVLKPYINKIKRNKANFIAIISGPIIRINKKNEAHNSKSIRLVYSGVIDKIKNGGAFICVQLATMLNSQKFNLSIYGFGDSATLADLQIEILKNNATSHTKVSYKGCLDQNELVCTLTSYDIGLATQYINTPFSSTSFPSKILTYLSAGLLPVCATSPALNSWKYNSFIHIYNQADLLDLRDWLISSYNGQLQNNYNVVAQIEGDIIKDLQRNL